MLLKIKFYNIFYIEKQDKYIPQYHFIQSILADPRWHFSLKIHSRLMNFF